MIATRGGSMLLLMSLALGAGCRSVPRRDASLTQRRTDRAARENRATPNYAGVQRALTLEKDAAAAEALGDLALALDTYSSALEALGPNPPQDVDNRLRERILALTGPVLPPLPPSAEARRLMVRATAIIENATGEEDLSHAVAELETASRASPWWSDVYYNLALTQEKAGELRRAARTWGLFLLADPYAREGAEVERRIIAVGVGAEKLEAVRQAEISAAKELPGDFGVQRLRTDYLDQTLHVCSESSAYEFFQGPRAVGKCINLITENEFVRRYRTATGRSDLDRYERRRNLVTLIATSVLMVGGVAVGAFGLADANRCGVFSRTSASLCEKSQNDRDAVLISAGFLGTLMSAVFLGVSSSEGTPQDRSMSEDAAARAAAEYNDAIRPASD